MQLRHNISIFGTAREHNEYKYKRRRVPYVYERLKFAFIAEI